MSMKDQFKSLQPVAKKLKSLFKFNHLLKRKKGMLKNQLDYLYQRCLKHSRFSQKNKEEAKLETTDEDNKKYIPLVERPYIKRLNGTWDYSRAGHCFVIPYRKSITKNTEQELQNQKSVNLPERTSLEILGSKRVWDRAGTGFSMPYQKPTKPIPKIESKKDSDEITNHTDH